MPAELGGLPDGRVVLTVRATDAAGNATERALGTLLLDRVTPPIPIVIVRRSAGATVVDITPQADPAPGSGVVGFVVSYRRAPGAPLRPFPAAASGDEQVQGRGTRARIAAPVEGAIPVRSFDRAGNVGGAYAAGVGFTRCVDALEGKPFIKPAKIGEVRGDRTAPPERTARPGRVRSAIQTGRNRDESYDDARTRRRTAQRRGSRSGSPSAKTRRYHSTERWRSATGSPTATSKGSMDQSVPSRLHRSWPDPPRASDGRRSQ